MSDKTLKTKIFLRNDTEEQWKVNNPVLGKGEIAISIDSDKFKIGDGMSAWTALDYANVTATEFANLSTQIATLKGKVDDITSTGGEPNTIETVKINGSAVAPVDKAVDITIASGTANGSLAVNGKDVSVKGLGTAAFTPAENYDKAGAASDVLGTADDTKDAKTVYGAIKHADDLNATMDVRVGNLETANSGKADKGVTLGDYGIGDAYTKAQTDDAISKAISAVFRYKGTKDTSTDLPSEGNTVGDVYFVAEKSAEYAWNGEKWEELGSTIDLSGYLQNVNIAGVQLTPGSSTISVSQLVTALGLNNAAYKNVDTAISSGSLSEQLPTSKAVASYVDAKETSVNSRIETLESKSTNVSASEINGHINVDNKDVVVYDATKETLSLDCGNSASEY